MTKAHSALAPVLSTNRTAVAYTYHGDPLEPRVSVGDEVQAGDILAERVGASPLIVIDVGSRLGRSGKAALSSFRHVEGEKVAEGSILVESAGRFGFGHREITAPVSGIIRSMIPEAGIVVIQPEDRMETITSAFPARVLRTEDSRIEVETEGIVLNACAGAGLPVFGRIALVDKSASVSDAVRTRGGTPESDPPRVLIFQSSVSGQTLQLVREGMGDMKPIAVVAPTIPYHDLLRIRENRPLTSVLVTEGFADAASQVVIPDTTWNLLRHFEGTEAVVLPDVPEAAPLLVLYSSPELVRERAHADVGTEMAVRTMRNLKLSYGTVLKRLEELRPLDSGVPAAWVRVIFEDGSQHLVAEDNLEVLTNASHMDGE